MVGQEGQDHTYEIVFPHVAHVTGRRCVVPQGEAGVWRGEGRARLVPTRQRWGFSAAGRGRGLGKNSECAISMLGEQGERYALDGSR